MNYFRRFFSIALPIVFGLLPPPLYAQSTFTAGTDSTFEAYMDSAWDTLRDTNMSEKLQDVYSKEFYEYYLQNPKTKTGQDALSQAFTMWGNTGNDTCVTEALQTLDYDSDIWGKIINSVGSIYHQSDRLDIETYYEMLVDLKGKLTDPVSKSVVVLSLLERAKAGNNKEKAIELARRLIEIDAAEYFTQLGFDYLYELESLHIGQKAPAFRAQTIEGDHISLADLNGQFVLLDFWITWWQPCLPKSPYLKTLWDRHKDSNFTIVGVSLDKKKSDLVEFVDEREVTWPQVFEAEGWSSEQAGMYNETGIPRTYLIDPNGVIVAKNLRGNELIYEVEKHIRKWETH